MTEAYIEGFCKAAEDYGVSPEYLAGALDYLEKSAQVLRGALEIGLGRAARSIGSGIGKEVLKRQAAARSAQAAQVAQAAKANLITPVRSRIQVPTATGARTTAGTAAKGVIIPGKGIDAKVPTPAARALSAPKAPTAPAAPVTPVRSRIQVPTAGTAKPTSPSSNVTNATNATGATNAESAADAARKAALARNHAAQAQAQTARGPGLLRRSAGWVNRQGWLAGGLALPTGVLMGYGIGRGDEQPSYSNSRTWG